MDNNNNSGPGSVINPGAGFDNGSDSEQASQPVSGSSDITFSSAAAVTSPILTAATPDGAMSDTIKPTNSVGSYFSEHSTDNVSPSPKAFSSSSTPPPKRKMGKWKPLIISLVSLVVLVGAAEAFYFGYYLNPNVVWHQGLVDSGTALTRLISYANTQNQIKYSGGTLTGSLSYSGSFNASGSLNEQYDSTSSTTSIKTSFLNNNLDFESRAITPKSATTPDIYIQFNGIKNLGLGSTLGVSEAQIAKVDGKWIVIDHTFLDQLKSQLSSQAASAAPKLTRQDIIDAATQFNNVSAQYVFTTNSSKAVTKVVKNFGMETVDGHKTIHYQVGFVKDNVKSYITALSSSLSKTNLGKWAVQVTGSNSFDDVINTSSLESSANNINSSDTIDVWTDVGTRLIYKLRIPDKSSTNAALNYVEYGLNYKKGSNNLPFFVAQQTTDSSGTNLFKLIAQVDTSTNQISANFTDGTNGKNSFTANLSFQPTKSSLNVTAPTGAISLQTALSDLGLSDFYNQILSSLSQSVPASGASYNAGLLSIVQYL